MSRFTLPRDLYFGPDAISELKHLTHYQKAFVVTGGHSMKRGGFLQHLEDVLKEAGMEVRLFEGVEPDPSIETVYRQGYAGIPAGFDCRHWRRFPHRCGQGHVGILRIS